MMNELSDIARRFCAESQAGPWVDTHCHLETFVRHGTITHVLENAQHSGVCQLVAAGTSPADWDIYRRLSAEHPGRVAYAAGLHPQEVNAQFETALAILESALRQTPAPVAIGEAGLDYYHLPKDMTLAMQVRDWQKAAFSQQIRWATRLGKPLVIHAREAFDDTVALLTAEGAQWNKVVFHCFAEGPEQIRFLRERGAFASFTGVITYKNAEKTRAACLAQGIDHLMLETDTPYLTPVPLRGKPNEPAHIAHTGTFVAELFGCPVATLAEKTTATARAFYDLPILPKT